MSAGRHRRLTAVAVAAALFGLVLQIETARVTAAPLPNGSTSFQIVSGNKGFKYTLPPSSVATFKFSSAADATSAQVALTTTKPSPTGGVFDQVLSTSTVALGARTGSSPIIGIDPKAVRQPIEGFGAAMTESAALAINSLSSTLKAQALETLFGASGARFNIVRVPMGSSDFNASNKYTTYDDTVGNVADPQLKNFSVARDAAIISALQAAQSKNASLKLLGVPWTAPAWMKTNVSLTCSYDAGLKPEYRSVYADYFVKFVTAYKAKNLPVFMVSMQNEPHNCKPHPTMYMTPEDQAALAGQLRPKLNAAGLSSVKIMAWDHNWAEDNATVASQYPSTAVKAPGGSNIDAIGYHHYGTTNPSFQQVGVATGRAVYLTEATGYASGSSVAQNLVWEVKNDLIGPIRNGARAVLYWNVALTDHGPTQGTCVGCRGMLEVNGQTKQYVQSEDLVYWQHFSKFVDPGAVRIETPVVSAPLENVAFQNPDGTIVVVVLNTDPVARGLLGQVVQNTAKSASWLVGPDGRRRYVGDAATGQCLKDQGIPGPVVVDNGTLDALPDVNGVWAVCGASRIGAGSMLQRGTYAKSPNGLVRLELRTTDGRVVLGNNGKQVWTPNVSGDSFKLEPSGDLVQYNAGAVAWSSGTAGSGATNLLVRDNGTIALVKPDNTVVWTAPTPTTTTSSTAPSSSTTSTTVKSTTTSTSTTSTTVSSNPSAYYGQIVQWNGDTKPQKTSWLVGPDGYRRYINDTRTFDCMKAQGIPGPTSLPSSTLEGLPDLKDVWALCGDVQMGTNSLLQRGTYLQSLNKQYKLAMPNDGTVRLTNSVGKLVWTPAKNGDRFILQEDGNLVHKNGSTVVWQSGTTASPGRYLRLLDSGDLVLYDGPGAMVWHSNTAGA